MYFNLIFGNWFTLEVRIPGVMQLLERRKQRKLNEDSGLAIIPNADTSAEEYTEEYSHDEYELKHSSIDDMAERFSSEISVDANGLYDVPPKEMKSELDLNMEDVEIITDEYEKQIEDKVKRIRGV